jgi:hypothetical protein
MNSVRPKIVTLASLTPPEKKVESAETSTPLAQTAESQLRLARYRQIMARLQQETAEVGSDVMITVPDREVSLAQSQLADKATETQPLPSGGQEVKFGTGFSGGDWLRWIWSVTDWVDRTAAHPMLRPKNMTPDTLSGDMRVAITADWGTGLYGAPKIADRMRQMATTGKFDVAMHLGDIYYSGTEDEVRDRFIDVWPTDAANINRALNANHEMYSGGFGYFKIILPHFNQEASYFALQNEHWLLVGLDTAYVDHDIDNQQVAWLNVVISEAQKPKPRKVVLFSHQQPFSRLDAQGPKLQKALRHLLEGRRIKAWYWGHEHDCVLYDEHPTWKMFGRCLGNGGIPSARNKDVQKATADPAHPGAGDCVWRRLDATVDSPGCIVLDGPNADMEKEKDRQKFVPHGFMTLEFKGNELTERVLLSNGTEVFANTLK